MTATTVIAAEPEPRSVRVRSVNRRILAAAWGMSSFKIGFFVFIALLLASAIYPEVSSVSATKMVVKDKFLAPVYLGDKWTWDHLLGTDQLGRDMLMRSLIGLRYSLLVGIVTVLLIFIIGCGLGLFAGFKGKWWDTIIMRITDAQLSIPMIILAITILGVSRPTVPTIIIVLALSGWPLYASGPQCRRRRARQGICARSARAWGRGLADSAVVRGAQHPAADRVRRGARRCTHDDLRSDPGLPWARHSAADPKLWQHHRRFPQISAQCLVDQDHPGHLPRRRAHLDQSHGLGAGKGAQPDLWRSLRWISRSFSQSTI